jgi:signal transduction histidine kinase
MPIETISSTSLSGDIGYYTLLVWQFVFIFTILVLFLCYLFLAKRRAEQREELSSAFSHLVIEGMETERRRIFRELHDTVLPMVRDASLSEKIRNVCAKLMPPDFSRLSLKFSLADLCDTFIKRTGIECACSIEDELDFSGFSAENQLHIYRMVQESLTNIEKHSQAEKAALVVRKYSRGNLDNILICISDDGKGIPAVESCEGFGMKIIRQRADILGAKIDFISESGNGLMVRIESPPH